MSAFESGKRSLCIHGKDRGWLGIFGRWTAAESIVPNSTLSRVGCEATRWVPCLFPCPKGQLAKHLSSAVYFVKERLCQQHHTTTE